MPWELGRCAFDASKRHVDVQNVIWLGTSNIGHDLVFQHQETRSNPEQLMSREEYIKLMALLRPKISKQLGVCCPYLLFNLFRTSGAVCLHMNSRYYRLPYYQE